MRFGFSFPAVLGRHHTLRRLAMRDALAFGVLVAITLGLFGATEFYYVAYNHYRASLGLPIDNSPVITLPVVRRH